MALSGLGLAGASSDGPGQEAAVGTRSSGREIASEPAEHRAAARGWGRGSVNPVAAVQQCQEAARSSHGWRHGAELSRSADQQCPTAGEKGGCRQVASGSE